MKINILRKFMKLNRLFLTTLAVAGIFASCQKEPQFITTDVGPVLTIESYSETALMGSKISFSVGMKDPIALSTLKARLYFDQDMVSETVIRTKEQGSYQGEIEVPFFAAIPDGTASLVFVGQNIQMGLTEETVSVSVSRPDFEYLTLITPEGESRMQKVAKYQYEVEGAFPTQCQATIESAPIDAEGTTIKFGWDGKEIVKDGEGMIPFSNSVSPYKISFNTLSFEGAPFISMQINGVKTQMVSANEYYAVLSLNQGDAVNITGYEPGFADFIVDPDYFERTGDSSLKFLPVSGLYKVNIDFKNKFFKVEAMKSETDLATLNADGTGAVWVIGGTCFGKPAIANGASWNPEVGGLCLAQVAPKVHQITLVAGSQVSLSDIDFKFFHQKTWGGEFGGEDISTDSDLFMVTSSGNINLQEGKSLERGGVYKFTVDLTGATSTMDGNTVKMKGAVLKVEQTGTIELPAPEITFAGTKLEALNTTEFEGVVDLTKGQSLSVTGVENVAGIYFDGDYLVFDGSGVKFGAVSGKYKVHYSLAGNYFRFNRLNNDGKDATFADNKTIWLMGWGVAYPVMSMQFAWDPGKAFCPAQIADGVYQLTGVAVDEKDGETMGGVFRYDYISMKYFHQNGWGGEMSGSVKLTENAAKFLKVSGNVELADGVKLELNAKYRLTITVDGSSETIDFVKL